MKASVCATTLFALFGSTVAAMPGSAPTSGFGVPVTAYVTGGNWQDCSSDGELGNVFQNPETCATNDGVDACFDECKEACATAHSAGAVEFIPDNGEAPECCCQGLTPDQRNGPWCHNENEREDDDTDFNISRAYYTMTCATQGEPPACVQRGVECEDDDDACEALNTAYVAENNTWTVADCTSADDSADDLEATQNSAPRASSFTALTIAASVLAAVRV